MAFHSNTCCLMLIGNDVEHVQRFAFRFIRMRRSFDCTRHKRGSSCLQKLATIELCAHFFFLSWRDARLKDDFEGQLANAGVPALVIMPNVEALLMLPPGFSN